MGSHDVNRRQVMVGLVSGLTLASVGCNPTIDPDDTDSDSEGTSSTGAWATGSTALLAADYTLPFDDACTQTCELTLGPCYAQTQDRADISEGVEGLPTRVGFRVVDTDCNPVPNAIVDIWHCSPSGLYSGEDAVQMCTDGDAEARAGHWFRGKQTTNADGVVTFDTQMPGWYPGRAVHIHLQVLKGGDAYTVSQLGFDEDLLADVFANHPTYAAFGQPDTPNSSDNILNRDLSTSLFDWSQAEDGALVIWKTLVIRRSLNESTC